MTENKSYLKLHLFVLIIASTAILGELISLPPQSLVIWRTGIAAIVLGIWLKGNIISFQFKRLALITGLILGAHWMTFFAAVNLANVSICLTGIATTSLFTAATEALQEKRLPHKHEIWIGLLIIPSIILIAGVESGYLLGLLCAIFSALLSSIFPVINKSMVRKGANAEAITFYEMLGAMVACALISIIFLINGSTHSNFTPSGLDWLWLTILALICTVFAYSIYNNLLKTFSAYETSLAINFEPVYGIILAAVLFHEHQQLHPLFFIGAATIVLANLLNPILAKRFRHSIK